MLSRSTRASLLHLHHSAAPINSSTSRIAALRHPIQIQQKKQATPFQRRNFLSTPAIRKGITPDSSDPIAPNPQSNNAATAAGSDHVVEATPLSDRDYHEVSEHYLNVLLGELERVQEEGSEIEAEYSAGVLNIVVPGIGTYVLNKQPPNHQIWLSSPISGPKRYDWVIQGDQMHEKQDTRGFINGQWIYLRDGSNLTDLLNDELTLELPEDIYTPLE
ncbi:mitochondrial chaperone Frataxin, putative [Talaromyces stipitatus ATCC 10500]|uniref:ferroxidase n=1 Tax=Talaromyces stipitatus (strain ATCC 10500 / CBS 375.48 / QM 6759 / NRRL 1006) TaxID=441959 RepID=B8LWR2_TALSN|nr:mitochondrial chaperone Frataxin, putative [Talaromyces stipitatus ATCC 10500]EED24459.1 mitochondrial chaperone Frataxin, putative [Talaromyces stipitatus ATCC 10500]